jgi:hypothetical protein
MLPFDRCRQCGDYVGALCCRQPGGSKTSLPLSDSQIIYAILVGVISTAGAFWGSWLSSRAALTSSDNSLRGIDRQIRLQRASKLAEFRQGWINDLRESMATFHSFGIHPGSDQLQAREFFKFGTQIELFINRSDPNYARLQSAMHCFVSANTMEQKFNCNAEYVAVCQDILKTEWDVLKEQLLEASEKKTSKEGEVKVVEIAQKTPQHLRADDRLDLVKRLFAIAISIGVGATFIKAGWIDAVRLPTGIEIDQICIVLLALFATVLSWDGYLTSVRTKPLIDTPRFAIDVALVFTYMFLIYTSGKSAYWLPIVCLMFSMYVMWDALTVRQFPEQYNANTVAERPSLFNVLGVYWFGMLDRRAINRGPIITLCWGLFFLELLWTSRHFPNFGVRWQVGLALAGLCFYRYDKRFMRGQVRGFPSLARVALIATLCGGAWVLAQYSGTLEAVLDRIVNPAPNLGYLSSGSNQSLG